MRLRWTALVIYFGLLLVIGVSLVEAGSEPFLSNERVSPSSGAPGTTFTYEVIYTNADGGLPSYVHVYIDGVQHNMVASSWVGENDNYIAGRRYVYNENALGVGSHTYYFEASGNENVVRLPENDNLSGPRVEIILVFKGPDGSPLINVEIYYAKSQGEQKRELGKTDSQGRFSVTDPSLVGQTVYFETADGRYAGNALVDPSGGEVRLVEISRGGLLLPLALVIAGAAASGVVVLVVRGRPRKPKPRLEGRGLTLVGYRSDIGKVRSLDEDSIAVLDVSSSHESKHARKILAIVTDGMGGHAKGEVASRICVGEMTEVLLPALLDKRTSSKHYEDAMREAFERANQEVVSHALDHPECAGMGCTASAAVIDDDQLYVGHVGDTRVYVVNGGIRQITKDHSVVQELVDKGEITPEEARKHPQKNVITRAVGVRPKLKADVYQESLSDGSYVVVCCDGLVNEVDNVEIRDAVLDSRDPQEACNRLVKLANERGGRDNVSVVVVGPLRGIKAETVEAKTVIRRPLGKRG
jgi:protein phosphatase